MKLLSINAVLCAVLILNYWDNLSQSDMNEWTNRLLLRYAVWPSILFAYISCLQWDIICNRKFGPVLGHEPDHFSVLKGARTWTSPAHTYPKSEKWQMKLQKWSRISNLGRRMWCFLSVPIKCLHFHIGGPILDLWLMDYISKLYEETDITMNRTWFILEAVTTTSRWFTLEVILLNTTAWRFIPISC